MEKHPKKKHDNPRWSAEASVSPACFLIQYEHTEQSPGKGPPADTPLTLTLPGPLYLDPKSLFI